MVDKVRAAVEMACGGEETARMSKCLLITFQEYMREGLGLLDDECNPVYDRSIDQNGDGVVNDDEVVRHYIDNKLYMDGEFIGTLIKQKVVPGIYNGIMNGIGRFAEKYPALGRIAISFVAPFLKYDPSIPLRVEFPNAEMRIYSGNAIFAGLMNSCVPEYIRPGMRVPAWQLDECLQEIGNEPIRQNGFVKIMELLEGRTVITAAPDREELQGIYDALDAAPEIEIDATSAIAGQSQSEAMREYLENHKELEHPNFSMHYRDIYGAPALPYPEGIKKHVIPLIPDTYRKRSYDGALESVPPLIRTVRRSADGSESASYIFGSMEGTVRAYLPEKIEHVHSLVRHFAPRLDVAAEILHRHHPHLKLVNLRSLLYSRMSEEVMALDFEDPWQDMNACRFSGCSLQDNFAKALAGSQIGPMVNGTVYNLPWELSSKIAVDMKRQGFGPMQVILGLAMEASENAEVLAHFEGCLSREDFKDEKAALRAILEKPVMTYALCYDYVATKLEKTVFSDPSVRLPEISAPYIQDRGAAREYSFLQVASLITAYPESDERAKDNVLGGVDLGESKFIWGDIYGIEPDFKTLKCFRQHQGKNFEDGKELCFYAISGSL